MRNVGVLPALGGHRGADLHESRPEEIEVLEFQVNAATALRCGSDGASHEESTVHVERVGF
jgi:hypothetical protein